MMNIFSEFQLHILLGGNALIVAAAAIAVLRFQRLIRRNEAFWASPTGARLTEDSGKADRVLCGFLDHRLGLMQARIDALAAPRAAAPEQREPAQATPQRGMPFEYAVRMARQGASVDDLVQACGLSRAEAKLIHRVHSPNRAEARPDIAA